MGLNPLTESERDRIDDAIKRAEHRTSAHLGLLVVPISDRYTFYSALWAASIAISVIGVVALLRPEYTILTGFLINSALFIILALVLDWTPLRVLIVPAKVKQRHAHDLAHREFALRIIAQATHRNSVMFFVSIAERYVEVLADREIHSRAGGEAWDKTVSDFIGAVRENRLADGLVSAVEACATILELHYPRSG
jgi:putative membrane protein